MAQLKREVAPLFNPTSGPHLVHIYEKNLPKLWPYVKKNFMPKLRRNVLPDHRKKWSAKLIYKLPARDSDLLTELASENTKNILRS